MATMNPFQEGQELLIQGDREGSIRKFTQKSKYLTLYK